MSLPKDFIIRTKALLGNEYPAFEEALSGEAPISVRLNTAKPFEQSLDTPVQWAANGYYLPKRPTFTFDPLFHAGAYYVQEASSMFLEQALKAVAGDEPLACLDLCAAPGGKSTLLRAALPEGSLLVSNEVIQSRSNILSENITKWGHPACIVTNSDPVQIGEMGALFDVIVTDVPCSGEGMFRKDSDSTDEWSVANVDLCAGRQRRIIRDIWPALKPGGYLIYSTCTYNLDENEENIEWIRNEFDAIPVSVPTQANWGIKGALKYDNPVYRFMPHVTRGEGFFLAVLQKPETADAHEPVLSGGRSKKKDKKGGGKNQPLPLPAVAKTWLQNSADYEYEVKGASVFAFPAEHKDVLNYLFTGLKIVSAGILVGEIKGKDLIPAQSLALSTALDAEAFNTCEVTRELAIAYLKKEALVLDADLPKGYLLLTYKQIPIGFVKHLGNRANNLYPQEWRIRTTYLPDEIVTLDSI